MTRYITDEDRALVRGLAQKHLGPVPAIDPATEAQVEAALNSVPGGEESITNCRAAVSAAGIAITDRQLKPYRNALIARRFGGGGGGWDALWSASAIAAPAATAAACVRRSDAETFRANRQEDEDDPR